MQKRVKGNKQFQEVVFALSDDPFGNYTTINLNYVILNICVHVKSKLCIQVLMLFLC